MLFAVLSYKNYQSLGESQIMQNPYKQIYYILYYKQCELCVHAKQEACCLQMHKYEVLH